MQKLAAAVNTFEVVARESHASKSETWKANIAKEAMNRLQKDIFPTIGRGGPLPKLMRR